MRRKILLFSLFIVLSLNIVLAADFDISNKKVVKEYVTGSDLSATMKIEFEEYPLFSYFEDNLGNEVLLKDLLDSNYYTYNCTPSCNMVYEPSNSETTKTFTLNAGEEKLVGFMFNEFFGSLEEFLFNITSDVGESKENQLKIDFLDDGIFDLGNTRVSNSPSSSSRDYSCFQSELVRNPLMIDERFLCQKVTLQEAPGFYFGTELEEEKTGDGEFKMYLFDGGTELGNCNLDKSKLISGGDACLIEYYVPASKDFLVCLQYNSTEGEYYIEGYPSSESALQCGFFTDYPTANPIYGGAYKIFSYPAPFGDFETQTINGTLPNGATFKNIIENYMDEKYGAPTGINCPPSGCAVPIKFYSTKNQTITLEDINIKIISSDENNFGTTEKISKISDLSVEEPLIDGESQNISLAGFFPINTQKSEIDYVLELGGKEIIDETFKIMNLVYSLTPLSAAQNFPETFVLKTKPEINFSKYSWDFGDGIKFDNNKNSASHIYNRTGNYTLKIGMQLPAGELITKYFTIRVESAEVLIKNLISELENNLDTITDQINKLDTFSQLAIKEKIGFENLSNDIAFVKSKSIEAKTPEDQKNLKAIIDSIVVPSSIFQKDLGAVPFFMDEEKINTEAIEGLTSSIFENGTEQDYVDAINFWVQNNLNMKASVNEIYSKTEEGTNLATTILSLNIKTKDGKPKNYYLVVEDIPGLKIQSNNILEYGGYKAVKIEVQDKTINIATPGLTLEELNFFFTPETSEVKIINIVEKEKKNYGLLIFYLFLILLFGFLAYFGMEQWYKRKYENYLFKDRNSLYNVMVFVTNEKNEGNSKEEIREKLKKAGWSAEQIRYILRKFHGEETGMKSLHLFDFFKKFKSIKSQKKAPMDEEIYEPQPSKL